MQPIGKLPYIGDTRNKTPNFTPCPPYYNTFYSYRIQQGASDHFSLQTIYYLVRNGKIYYSTRIICRFRNRQREETAAFYGREYGNGFICRRLYRRTRQTRCGICTRIFRLDTEMAFGRRVPQTHNGNRRRRPCPIVSKRIQRHLPGPRLRIFERRGRLDRHYGNPLKRPIRKSGFFRPVS